jgi:hypothetical protein
MTTSTNSIFNSDWITDGILRQPITNATPDSRVTGWVNAAEEELISIALSNDVPADTFIANVVAKGINYEVKKYGIVYCCFKIAEDLWGSTSVDDPMTEIYKAKLDYYKLRCEELRLLLTAEMFLYDDDNIPAVSRVGVGRIFRG